MGVIETKGKAEQRYECDIMTVKVTFYAAGEDSSVISKTVMESCEKFINDLTEFSMICIKDINIDDDNVNERHYISDSKTLDARRSISIQTPFDMKLVNLIRQHLDEGGYRYNIDVKYDYSRVNELHAEMVKAALGEAKQQADMLAESLGLKVESLKKAEEQGGRYTQLLHCEQERERGICNSSAFELSDQLSGNVKTMAVEVYAEWKVG